jgi:hypothetical protein
MALVGGSHSVHWLPALDLIAKQTGWRIVVYTKSNCLFSVEMERVVLDRWCEEWNDTTLRLLRADRPELIVTTATRGSGAEEHVPEGFVQRWAQLAETGMRIVAIRDTPWMKLWVPECLEMKGLDAPACARPRSEIYADANPVGEAIRARVPHVHFVDMSDFFCDARSCPPVIGNIVVYRDDSHLTATYSRTLAPMLRERLMAGMPVHWQAPLLPGS